jgi:hypothetical protein
MDMPLLMERLRVQGLIQRLRREHGDEAALEIVQRAFELELPKFQKTTAKTHTREHQH